MNVLIDPGHGGKDPGAVANSIRECDINLSVGLFLKTCLKEYCQKVWMTRRTDKSVGLRERTDMEHSLRPDITVSLHCNAGQEKAKGFEVWTSVGETASDHAASKIINGFHTDFPSRKVRYDLTDGEEEWDLDREKSLWMCRKTIGPSVLIEMGFVTNGEEANWLSEQRVQAGIAKAISRGIMAWEDEV